jgi:hypothetical protein
MNETLTRTIKVSCFPLEGGTRLSRFLHELLYRREFCNGLKPGLASQHVIELLQLDYFQISRQVIGAYATPQAAPQICNTGLLLVFPPELVPRHSSNASNLYHECKNTRHTCLAPGRIFRLKKISNRSVASPGNTTSLYCRAVSVH